MHSLARAQIRDSTIFEIPIPGLYMSGMPRCQGKLSRMQYSYFHRSLGKLTRDIYMISRSKSPKPSDFIISILESLSFCGHAHGATIDAGVRLPRSWKTVYAPRTPDPEHAKCEISGGESAGSYLRNGVSTCEGQFGWHYHPRRQLLAAHSCPQFLVTLEQHLNRTKL